MRAPPAVRWERGWRLALSCKKDPGTTNAHTCKADALTALRSEYPGGRRLVGPGHFPTAPRGYPQALCTRLQNWRCPNGARNGCACACQTGRERSKILFGHHVNGNRSQYGGCRRLQGRMGRMLAVRWKASGGPLFLGPAAMGGTSISRSDRRGCTDRPSCSRIASAGCSGSGLCRW
jgi:hypothetical protein